MIACEYYPSYNCFQYGSKRFAPAYCCNKKKDVVLVGQFVVPLGLWASHTSRERTLRLNTSTHFSAVLVLWLTLGFSIDALTDIIVQFYIYIWTYPFFFQDFNWCFHLNWSRTLCLTFQLLSVFELESWNMNLKQLSALLFQLIHEFISVFVSRPRLQLF